MQALSLPEFKFLLLRTEESRIKDSILSLTFLYLRLSGRNLCQMMSGLLALLLDSPGWGRSSVHNIYEKAFPALQILEYGSWSGNPSGIDSVHIPPVKWCPDTGFLSPLLHVANLLPKNTIQQRALTATPQRIQRSPLVNRVFAEAWGFP